MHAQRREWEGIFAEGGQMALGHIENAPFDVIVTDLKMPGMDGEELLRLVAAQHPHVIRIMLSGEPGLEHLRKHGGSAHQYLNKPCSAETLFDSIERVHRSLQCPENALVDHSLG